MPAPTNTSAATAIEIASLPYSTTQDTHDAGTTYTVWYKYTALEGDNVVAAFGFGDLVTYTPTVSVWTGPAAAPVAWLSIAAVNRPIQFPVTGGVTYYLKIAPNGGNPTPAEVALEVQKAPALDIVRGSIFINDDTDGFPAAALSFADGSVLNFVKPFAAGEAGDVLPLATPVYLFEDNTAVVFKVYDENLAFVKNVTFGAHAKQIRAHLPSQTFYLGNAGSGGTAATVTTLSSEGVLGGTTWTLQAAGLTALAASNDETLLYYAGTSGALGSPVYTWDTVGDVQGSNFQAGVAGYRISDILVLDDDSVVVSYFKTTVTRDFYVKRFNAAGTLLNTYSFGTDQAVTNPRLASALDDESFWVWTHTGSVSGQSRFRQIKVSDGSTLRDFTQTEFEGGAYQGDATATPTNDFGFSFSCPIVILRAGVEGGGGGGGGGGTLGDAETRYIRRVRMTPHLSTEEMRNFHSYLQIDLETGVGLKTGQGSDPVLMLRYSNDGGHTWSNERMMSVGLRGKYHWRVIARRLGTARDRVYEVSTSDPVPYNLVAAYLEALRGNG